MVAMLFRSVILLAISLPVCAQQLAFRPFETAGFAALQGGRFEECATIFGDAAKVHVSEPSPAFVAARCYARAGASEAARRHLASALDRGYRNCANIRRDEILSSFSDLMTRCESNAERFVIASNPELLAGYLSDREDRTGPIADPPAVMRRDAQRRNVVRLAIATRTIRTPADHLHAALVMQHGTTPDEFALARDLAKRAAEMEPSLAEARWLYAAATDRYLRSTGRPQIFGTQYQQVDGRWTLEPFDENGVTDEERARWRVHSLAERQRFIDELNAESQ